MQALVFRAILPLGLALLSACATGGLAADRLLGVPGSAPTLVEADGTLREDWGGVRFGLRAGAEVKAPAGAEARFEGGPVVVSTCSAGDLEMRLTAFRAPIWPSGYDVVEVALSNPSGAEASGELVLTADGPLTWGEKVGQVGTRPVARLPEGLSPTREPRDWGCASGSARLPGWGRPAIACDPAYGSIRADFAKEPIVYRFRVRPGSRRQVFVGLLESHWAAPGSRPITLYIEGAAKTIVDPVAEFGQHRPGCLRFEAYDKNGDGFIQVVAAGTPGAADSIPILNAVWVFSDDDFLPSDEVLRGLHSASAEYYVGCGGEKDQDLYEGRELRFPLRLAAGETRVYPFLFATQAGQLPAGTSAGATAAAHRQAAEAVWADWLGGAGRRLDAEGQAALAYLALAETQTDDFYIIPDAIGGGVSLATHALAALALDQAGLHRQAERLLRVLWDPDAPGGLPLGCANEAGVWPDPAGDPEGPAWALLALARHANLAPSPDWTPRALGVIERVAQTLLASPKAAGSPRERALAEVGRVRGLSPALRSKLPAGSGEALPGFAVSCPSRQAAAVLLARAIGP